MDLVLLLGILNLHLHALEEPTQSISIDTTLQSLSIHSLIKGCPTLFVKNVRGPNYVKMLSNPTDKTANETSLHVF